MDFESSWIGLLMALCHLALRVRGEEVPVCGGVYDATEAGYITSPGYPLEYPPHQNCHWIITVPEPSQRIVLNFNPHFEIERLDCKYDFIEIRDGTSENSDVLGRHCSNIAPAPIISSGSSLQIRFVSDYAHQGAGFSLRYEVFKTDEISQCDRLLTPVSSPNMTDCLFLSKYPFILAGSEFCFRNFTSSSGMIDSPGFPDKYPHNLECSYMIIAPPHMDIVLTFLTFDLENDPLLVGEGDCKYDWLDVWDGLPQVSPLIGRYCGTKIPPEIQSSSGLLSLSFHTDMAVAKDGFSARYNMTHKEVSNSFHCSMALGMESGKISDDQISASTSFYDSRWLPRQARLNNGDNAWTPSEDSNKEYIQVDLHFLKVLTGIVMQGAVSKETQKSYYVTTFKMEVSTNGEDWMVYRHGKNHKVGFHIYVHSAACEILYETIFHGNTDPTEVVLNRVPQPVLARFVRIRPQTWKNGIALRFELYGCQITDAPCSELQGLLSGLLPDTQISVSSSRDLGWSPSTARLVASRSGWFPAPAQPLAGEEWLQRKKKQGRIRISFQIFSRGNTHYDAPELRRFEEIVSQYIRLYPERWSPAGIGMRVEILGCELPEMTTPADTATPTVPADTETTTATTFTTVATYPPSDSICDFDQGLCGWTHDPNAPLLWTLHRHELNSYLYMDASLKTEQQQAWIVSPVLGADSGPLCLSFSYQLSGEAQGHLKVLLRDAHNEETVLWTLKDDQGPVWREGRTILPRSPKDFQNPSQRFLLKTQGEAFLCLPYPSTGITLWPRGRPPSPGGGHLGQGPLLLPATPGHQEEPASAYHSSSQCFQYSNWSSSMAAPGVEPVLTLEDPMNLEMDVFSVAETLLVEWNTASPSSDPPVTRVSEKDNSWLYTLDPILVTIIVMSSLGVVLGAVCAGLLLYCTCSYSGLSSRSSTTLENYNFELYDGLKHKVKLNQQRCCTEA
ncbi:hypothetical protein F7725_009071 [Dissostichus mawsoni]|uniref:Neuropilin n=1 Tax=Dissostichus mawsoni TaxID=36200 RepID=A0A7J5Z5X6_DISMA|nr:hypothetical protein F7725_009071 [Dissostichus mawsoni]